MKMMLTVLICFIIVSPLSWAATNPARQYEQQRNSESPSDGIWHVYDRKGFLLREEHYKNYRLSGDIKTFYPSGGLKEIVYYNDGFRQGNSKIFYENGSIASNLFYKDNNLNGPYEHYYESGELESTYAYDNGQLIGEKKSYYKNGALKQTLNYKNGVIDGVVLSFEEDGKVTLEESYDNGNLISRKPHKDGDVLVTKPIDKPIAPKTADTPAVPAKNTNPPKDTAPKS